MLTVEESNSSSGVRKRVYAELRAQIVELKILPGTRLVEREIMAQLGVSRSSVREALRELEADHLVNTEKKMTFVTVPTKAQVTELYQVRSRIESLMVARFVEFASKEDILALRSAFEEFCHASRPDSRLTSKNKFYLALGQHSVTIHSILESLNARVAFMRSLSLSRPGRHLESQNEIEELVKAIEAQDLELSVRLAEDHAECAMSVVLEILEESPWYGTHTRLVT